MKIQPEVAHKLGHYVYLYSDPRNGRPFYVGKGKGSRVLAHMGTSDGSKKAKALRTLKRRKLKPRIEILAHRLPNEESAFRIESAVIDLFGLDALTNKVRGQQSGLLGRMPLNELVKQYRPKKIRIRHPVLLIRINQLFSRDMSAQKLYEVTRGVWRLSRDRVKSVKYALAVYNGVVREVYIIASWHRAGSTPYKTVPQSGRRMKGRLEFKGDVAPKSIRRLYLDGSVERFFSKGSQNPVVYVNA